MPIEGKTRIAPVDVETRPGDLRETLEEQRKLWGAPLYPYLFYARLTMIIAWVASSTPMRSRTRTATSKIICARAPKSLQTSLRFPGNANFRARDKTAKPPRRLCRTLAETKRPLASPPIRGFSLKAGKFPLDGDWEMCHIVQDQRLAEGAGRNSPIECKRGLCRYPYRAGRRWS